MVLGFLRVVCRACCFDFEFYCLLSYYLLLTLCVELVAWLDLLLCFLCLLS